MDLCREEGTGTVEVQILALLSIGGDTFGMCYNPLPLVFQKIVVLQGGN